MAASDQSVLVLLNGPYKGSGQEDWESISGNSQRAPNKTKQNQEITSINKAGNLLKVKTKSLIWYVS